ncbi:accessory factor UbiK family protein [Pseudomaricurvus sp. HS19]|uniref:accessory factor UbiK family protein n=1 Tax=Pseudomaricurvus sp. HS19 TaxID=2692626 RepID=UPI00136C1055|nr:accessory factor UbiK family protein [Pseudomaricurvus sp. HS19]MYM63851.1 accessory factor UbiK family protein [Pseudomaricurvus sp. HS19]
MFDKLAKGLLQELQAVLPLTSADLPEREVRALLESALRKMNLVTREEFDAQSAVLLRTREKLEALEKLVAELEQQNS